MFTELKSTENDPEHRPATVSPVLYGKTFKIGNDYWVVTQHTRKKLVMKSVQSELHAIRLKVNLEQMEMKNRLGISQAQYSRYESGLYEIPEELMVKARGMLPKTN